MRKSKRYPVIGRFQLKIALSYLAVIAVILVLLNTYPLWTSQSIVFQYKQSSLLTQVSIISASLSSLDKLTPEYVEKVLASVEIQASLRVVVCDEEAFVIYDSSLRESAVGKAYVFSEVIQALSGNDVFSSSFSSGAFESRVSVPVMNKGRLTGAIYLYDYDAEQGALLENLQQGLSTFSITITSAIILLSLAISVALSSRVNSLLRAIRIVKGGSYGHKIPIRGNDELSEVAVQLNDLSERLSDTEALRRRFVSDASHELKTPLASVRLLADSILQNEDMDILTLKEFMYDISDEIDRLTRLTEKLMQITRLETLQNDHDLSVFSTQVIIRRAEKMILPYAEKEGIELRCELSDNALICGDPDDFYLIVYNLVENAIKYNKPNGTVRVYCYRRDTEVVLIVEDTGIGIPQDDLPRIFDRFYRVDKARSRSEGGNGLGLAIVAQTLSRLHGDIKAESVMGAQTRFTLTFPPASESII